MCIIYSKSFIGESKVIIAYFDCFAGAAGDMIVAAMLHAGLDKAVLTEYIKSLKIPGLKLNITKTTRHGIDALTFKPQSPEQTCHKNLNDITEIINKSSIPAPAKTRALDIFQLLAQAEAAVHATTLENIHFHDLTALEFFFQ